jgi:hypothetical protein
MMLTCGALLALDQHLHGAVGQLEHLQDGGDAADLEHVLDLGLVLGGGLLRHQHDAAAGFHGRFQRLDALGAPTNSGITMCGNTTTSRSGSSGSVMGWRAGGGVRTWESFFLPRYGPQRLNWGRGLEIASVGRQGRAEADARSSPFRRRPFGCFAVDQQRRLALFDGDSSTTTLATPVERGQVEHGVEQDAP